ncbi:MULTISPECIES: hypothetical protein [Haloferacaceae]|uniref:MarR family transcriptional regulator n=1 Tax=Halorubrum glutamatedens TaxID=2707018 RepID=A0ABD5QMI8_9EURY|nr:hypothetical protein [Halobellus captivus]
MTTIHLSQTERYVLTQIHDGNHTIEDLITATGFPRPRLRTYLTWLAHDDFIEVTRTDGPGSELHIDLTDRGIERCTQPDSRHPLTYV